MMWSDSPRRLVEFAIDYLDAVSGGGEKRRAACRMPREAA